MKSSAQPVLQAIVELWKQHPEWMKVRIEGHADIRGDASANQALSERRAANVRANLIKLGLNPEVITAEGFGATRLLNTGTTEEDHRANRRVEFVVIARYGDEGAPDLPAPASSAPDRGRSRARTSSCSAFLGGSRPKIPLRIPSRAPCVLPPSRPSHEGPLYFLLARPNARFDSQLGPEGRFDCLRPLSCCAPGRVAAARWWDSNASRVSRAAEAAASTSPST